MDQQLTDDNHDMMALDPDPVLCLWKDWHRIVKISQATAEELRRKGRAPELTHVSKHLLGVRRSRHLQWLDQRTEKKEIV